VTLVAYKPASVGARRQETVFDGDLIKEIMCTDLETLLQECLAMIRGDKFKQNLTFITTS
jgi:hypothetical protein